MKPGSLAYRLVSGAAYGFWPFLRLGGVFARGSSRLSQVVADLAMQAGRRAYWPEPGPGPRVWLQAVSVGEMHVAAAVARHLLAQAPQVRLTVTSSTSRGLDTGHRLLPIQVNLAPYPLDLPHLTAKAAGCLRPHVYAVIETELWPGMVSRLHARGAALFMLSGRISPRSFRRYLRLRPVIAPCLNMFDHLSMISKDDMARIIALGAPPERVSLGGGAKFDGLLERAEAGEGGHLAQRLNLGARPLLVLGSVRGAEREAVIWAVTRILTQRPDVVIALAPRHVEKSSMWLGDLARRRLDSIRFSLLGPGRPRRESERVVMVDTMGDLFGLYGLARAAFLGASLTPLGGQNPMEPAAWGTPVFFGPSMEDFKGAAQALVDEGGGEIVHDGLQLAAALLEALARPDQAAARGRSARRVLAAWPGAAAQAADLIVGQLERQGVLS